MTPERFEHLVSYFCDNVVTVEGDYLLDVEKEARADLAAMRQPITAEALTDDGWILSPEEEAYWTPDLANNPNTVWVQPDGDNPAIVEVEWALEEQHIPFVDVATMYDLRELVRLLGGENA
jgi:hypothetical protein